MREGARAERAVFLFCYLFLVRFRLGKVKVKVWKNGGFGRRVEGFWRDFGATLFRPKYDENDGSRGRG